jgi:hypothetical protein
MVPWQYNIQERSMDPQLEARVIAHRVVLAYLVHITGARDSESPQGVPTLAETMLATSMVRLVAGLEGPADVMPPMTAARREIARIFTPPDDWLQREMAGG